MRNNYCAVLIILILISACKSGNKQNKIANDLSLYSEHTSLPPRDEQDFAKLIYVNSNICDIGIVKEGAIIENEYIIANQGNYPLLIYNFWVSCNCTEVDIKKTMLMPNDTTTFTLKLNTKNKYGSTMVSAKLITNTETKYHIFKLRCDVKQ